MINHHADSSGALGQVERDVATLVRGVEDIRSSPWDIQSLHSYGNSAILLILVILVSVFLFLVCYRRRTVAPPPSPSY